jgi:hypothetical protein
VFSVVDRPQFNSLIVDEFPPIFKEFRAKSFELLRWGSRDGFGAAEFHCRCDGQVNILTLILNTSGNTFGGFTPVEWDSSSGYKGDDSVRSFLFTLKNPHGVLTRKFALRGEKKQNAICCNSGFGPIFDFVNICAASDCNASTRSFTQIGMSWGDRTYANDTIIAEFLTGAFNFAVTEIEAFKIADSMALLADREKCANGCSLQEIARNAGGRVCKAATSRGISPGGSGGPSGRYCG